MGEAQQCTLNSTDWIKTQAPLGSLIQNSSKKQTHRHSERWPMTQLCWWAEKTLCEEDWMIDVTDCTQHSFEDQEEYFLQNIGIAQNKSQQITQNWYSPGYFWPLLESFRNQQQKLCRTHRCQLIWTILLYKPMRQRRSSDSKPDSIGTCYSYCRM